MTNYRLTCRHLDDERREEEHPWLQVATTNEEWAEDFPDQVKTCHPEPHYFNVYLEEIDDLHDLSSEEANFLHEGGSKEEAEERFFIVEGDYDEVDDIVMSRLNGYPA